MPARDAADGLPLTLGEEPAFCPACGKPVVPQLLEADHRPRLVCPDGHVTWRNPRLVVGTLPVRAGRVFLARRAIEPGAGLWTYPGGFLEIGEAAQEGARRETEEETQLRVEVGRLIGAYSRPHAGVVTLVYEATVVGGEPLPGAETTEVAGFAPDEIPM
jgi:ADP-ribose pyrophosphatase YjhB (NUDIX family)